ncbi:MAG TPA: AIR synthase-related protein [Terriglobales bacterium]|nr:AIR synthase-related protein [Terriglobales bacterium]
MPEAGLNGPAQLVSARSLRVIPPVHAMTDVTGFGVLGHALEMARGAQKAVTIKSSELPFLKEALAQKGFVTGASERNWKSYDTSVALPDGTPEWQR